MKIIEPFYKEVGRRIQTIRNELGMTQEYLGKKLDPEMTRAGIANIETGKQRLLAYTLVQIAQALDKEVKDLLPPPEAKAKPVEGTVEAELAQKLNLPNRELKKLTAQIHSTGHRRRKKQ